MKLKSTLSFGAVVIASIAIITTAQASNKKEASLLEQIERNEAQIIELQGKLEKLEARLGNVEVGLGEAHAQLQWKVQPLASDAK